MKKNSLFVGMMVFVLFLVFSGSLPSVDLKSVPLAANLYLIEGMDGGNVAFLVTEAGVLVVDSGTSPAEGKRIVDEIAKVTPKPIRYLVLTHYHYDHTYGLQSFPRDTIVIGQQNLAENIRKISEVRLHANVDKNLPEAIAAKKEKVDKLKKKKSKEWGKEEAKLKELEADLSQLKEIRIVYPSITFDSRLSIALGGETIEVIFMGSGHTNGDSLVYFPGLKVIHMGDLFFSGSFPYIGAEAGADTANWIETVKKVSNWAIEKFIPGHGPVANREGLLRQAAYLSDLREAVKTAIASGQTLDQMKKSLALPAWKDMQWKEIFPQNIEAVYNELKK